MDFLYILGRTNLKGISFIKFKKDFLSFYKGISFILVVIDGEGGPLVLHVQETRYQPLTV